MGDLGVHAAAHASLASILGAHGKRVPLRHCSEFELIHTKSGAPAFLEALDALAGRDARSHAPTLSPRPQAVIPLGPWLVPESHVVGGRECGGVACTPLRGAVRLEEHRLSGLRPVTLVAPAGVTQLCHCLVHARLAEDRGAGTLPGVRSR